jgi:hypothetical protein
MNPPSTPYWTVVLLLAAGDRPCDASDSCTWGLSAPSLGSVIAGCEVSALLNGFSGSRPDRTLGTGYFVPPGPPPFKRKESSDGLKIDHHLQARVGEELTDADLSYDP